MRRKIIGVTVGTPISPARIDREIKPVKTVNGVAPDENGNVEVKASGGNALIGSASGEVVALKDVSPLEHNLKVKISGVDNPEAVKLLVQGGNLLSLDKFEGNSWDNTTLENGVIKQVAADTDSTFSFKVQYLVNGSYHQLATVYNISAPRKIVASFTCDNPLTYLRFGVNGSQRDTIASFRDLNLPAGDYTLSLNLTNAAQGSISWEEMMLDARGKSDKYEPYKEPIEYAYGEEIKSIYPSTTLMTDTKGALITVEYNKDANKVVKSLEDRISALEAMIVSQ